MNFTKRLDTRGDHLMDHIDNLRDRVEALKFHVKARSARCGLITAVAAGVLLASVLVLPATAGAQFLFEVKDTRDEGDALPGDGECRSVSGTCTLRAALEEINHPASPGCDVWHQIILPAGHIN